MPDVSGGSDGAMWGQQLPAVSQICLEKVVRLELRYLNRAAKKLPLRGGAKNI